STNNTHHPYPPRAWPGGGGGGAGRAYARGPTGPPPRDEEDAPDALDKDRGWGEVLLAAALQGALFAVARSAADRTGAKAVERSTGVWPSSDKGGRD
ncbi:DUF4235 domain-containing protein, partial [Streptomyces mirabilis]|uniref:DUF4235 domain-containing protein n=1 Tax=Streptomyces mirabilis TaxID=68239 RepID=UPI0036A63B43